MIRLRPVFCGAAALLLLSAAAPPLCAQTLAPGPQVLTFYSDVDDTEQPYALYLPPGFDASKRYPLVVSLHGAGSNHRLNLRRVFGRSNAEGETDVEASRAFPDWAPVDYLVAAPFARGTMGYQGIAEKDVLDVLADVKRRFPVDEDRVYLTGLSMGGGGALWLGLTRPDVWAAVAPVCPAPPEGTMPFAPNALNLPLYIFQGGDDPVVKPESVRAWVERLQGLGSRVEYMEYPGVGHDSWVNAYQDGQLFEWFAQFRRNPYPDRVRFTTDRYKYDRAYWVRLDALTPGTFARIDARFTGPNRLEITTTDLRGFTLHPAGHARFTPGPFVELTIDGQALRVPAADSLAFNRQGGAWALGPYAASPQAKRPGLEGPMREAIAGRHLYVYGTDGDPSPEALAERRAQAERAAAWSVYRGPFMNRIMVFPRVAADHEVRPSDLADANLVLFGTKETNRVIAGFGEALPLALDTPEGFGLVYVYPVNDRYVLVNSGLPWWQEPPPGADRRPAAGFSFGGGVPALELRDGQDYLLFEGFAENVIAEGRFDAAWRLPEAEAKQLTATGVVTVRDP